MKCPACGIEAAEGDAFCGHCGHALRTVPQAAPPPPTPPPLQPPTAIQGSAQCLVCGATLAPHEATCRVCRTPRGYRVDPAAPNPVRYVSPSGSVAGYQPSTDIADVPAEIRGGWNWGGCTMGCLWAFAMNLPFWGILALLGALCSPLSLAVSIILGLKGNEWAWKNRRFESVEHFRRVQRIWAVVGISVTVGVLVLYAVYIAAVVAMGLGP